MMTYDPFERWIGAIVPVRTRHFDVEQGRRAERVSVFLGAGLQVTTPVVVAVCPAVLADADLRDGVDVELLVGEEVTQMAGRASGLPEEQHRPVFRFVAHRVVVARHVGSPRSVDEHLGPLILSEGRGDAGVGDQLVDGCVAFECRSELGGPVVGVQHPFAVAVSADDLCQEIPNAPVARLPRIAYLSTEVEAPHLLLGDNGEHALCGGEIRSGIDVRVAEGPVGRSDSVAVITVQEWGLAETLNAAVVEHHLVPHAGIERRRSVSRNQRTAGVDTARSQKIGNVCTDTDGHRQSVTATEHGMVTRHTCAVLLSAQPLRVEELHTELGKGILDIREVPSDRWIPRKAMRFDGIPELSIDVFLACATRASRHDQCERRSDRDGPHQCLDACHPGCSSSVTCSRLGYDDRIDAARFRLLVCNGNIERDLADSLELEGQWIRRPLFERLDQFDQHDMKTSRRQPDGLPRQDVDHPSVDHSHVHHAVRIDLVDVEFDRSRHRCLRCNESVGSVSLIAQCHVCDAGAALDVWRRPGPGILDDDLRPARVIDGHRRRDVGFRLAAARRGPHGHSEDDDQDRDPVHGLAAAVAEDRDVFGEHRGIHVFRLAHDQPRQYLVLIETGDVLHADRAEENRSTGIHEHPQHLLQGVAGHVHVLGDVDVCEAGPVDIEEDRCRLPRVRHDFGGESDRHRRRVHVVGRQVHEQATLEIFG